ncbi:hypothetical protein AQUCO_12500016v1 [Aquilegia coerulea]|uniref:Uncharacterized protein n=1 Tax=Aquilegia coerulea TaxID=218851 RepID=A0A2G5C1I4_AQUCA|nr:hypothetical protein AQUCO_12500016v1 [Aquilegia coerulea]
MNSKRKPHFTYTVQASYFICTSAVKLVSLCQMISWPDMFITSITSFKDHRYRILQHEGKVDNGLYVASTPKQI